MKKRLVALLLLAAVASSGCYGSFELTRKLWKWNGGVGDKWVNEGVFLVLNIIPAYPVCALIDAIALNSVKFWTGKSALQTRTVEEGDLRAVMTSRDDGVLRIAIYRSGTLERVVEVTPRFDGTMQAQRSDGVRLTAGTMPDGSVVVRDADGKTVAMHRPEEASRYTRP